MFLSLPFAGGKWQMFFFFVEKKHPGQQKAGQVIISPAFCVQPR
jgi:hypothetical protein